MLHLIALRLIPAPLHRGGYRLAHAARKLWWRLRKPVLTGCRIVARDDEGRVLLVRHSYGTRRWMLPGGGVGRGEDPIAAALRELREETGCGLLAPHEVARIDEPLHGARNVVHVVAGGTADMPLVDHREIEDARFFAPEALPDDMPVRMREGLPGWLKAAKAARPAHPPPRPSPPPPRSPGPKA